MEEKRTVLNGAPTFEMIPTLMVNLIEDNKVLSAKLDAINRKLSASMGNNKDEDERMDVTEAQKYIPGHPAIQGSWRRVSYLQVGR